MTMDQASIPQKTREQIGQIGDAELVVGILDVQGGEKSDGVSMVRDAIGTLSQPPKTVVIRSHDSSQVVPSSEAAANNGHVIVIDDPAFGTDPSIGTVQTMAGAYQSVFAAGNALGARACCVVASNLQTVTSRWISRLVQPVLEKDLDLVTPCYARHKFEGLLNSSVISPLNRALYGRQIQNPMGPDLGCSQRLLQKLTTTNGNESVANQASLLARLAPEAIRGGMQICQAHVGARVYPPTDWVNLSSLLAQILGPVFQDMDANASHWQRIRGSQPIQRLGEQAPISEETGAIDVHRMLDSFQLGTKNLPEIWGLVMPPATLLELRKLARLPAEQFRVPDQLWARIVYDFSLGYRLRTISRDHLLRALTPLYLGWVASYAVELEAAGAVEVDRRLEQLALAYEATKPYLVSRWRWPDRFSP